MRRSRWLLIVLLAVIVIGASWLWWVKPSQVDMAAHAPANSLLYLETNNPLEVVQALESTEAWRIVENFAGRGQNSRKNAWLHKLVGWTGIGPIESVILARAQVAVIITDLGTTEDAETLRIKPEAALIIETKTSEHRIRPAVEKAVKKLAELTYGKPSSRAITIDGVDFTEWVAPDGSRQIVSVIYGSLVIIGNTRQAVQTCLAVSQGLQPSLKEDAELNRLRLELGGAEALSFGYVPTSKSARLLSIGVPLLMGRAPANSEFQRLISSGASKVFGSIGWSCRPFMAGIEDRFLISLQPSILDTLKPTFTPINLSSLRPQLRTDEVHSVTYYNFGNPILAWQALKTSVSSQVDALSAIIFTSLLNSSLGSYGIVDPEQFLSAVNSDIVTLRMDQNAERSLLVARVRDQAKLRELLTKTMRVKATTNQPGQVEMLEDPQGELSASFVGEFVVLGAPTDVRRYTEALGNSAKPADPNKLKKLTFFAPSSSANIMTYADDSDRVRDFVAAVLAAKGVSAVVGSGMDQLLYGLPYSSTETTLGDRGLERTTRSPLGQFSTLLPLLIPAERARATP